MKSCWWDVRYRIAAPVFERYFLFPEFTALRRFSKVCSAWKPPIFMRIFPGIGIADAQAPHGFLRQS
jgi:hypothetical protein